jgi:hypothetical protein
MRAILSAVLTIAAGDATFLLLRLSMPGRSACFAKDQKLHQTNDRFFPSNGIVIAKGE